MSPWPPFGGDGQDVPDPIFKAPDAPTTSGAARIVGTGSVCACGGLMVRTGACETCPQCGTNTGCG